MSTRKTREASASEDQAPGQRSGSGASSLWLHMAQDAQRKTEAGSLSATIRPPERSRFTVLVVDDNHAARYALARTLNSAGYKTIQAAGGAEALLLARQAAALVLDVHLPDVHGFEVCRMLRARTETATLPIIHVSAVFVEAEHQEAGASAGADAYLLAPVEPDELVDAVDLFIAKAAARVGRR